MTPGVPTVARVRKATARRAVLAVSVALLAAGAATASAGPFPAGTAGASGQVSPDGPSGMDLDAALSRYTTGDPSVVIAYVEGGINWHLPEARQLAPHVYVNWHETPVPCNGTTMIVGGVTEPCRTVYSTAEADYDTNHDGVVNAADWAHDPRVHDVNHNGYLDPEDLIAAFGAGPDHQSTNAYPHDISGWNFYRDNNDPATADATYTHPDDQMANITAACPRCLIMPVKAGAEALDPTDALAQAWLFACQHGASVIDSVTADVGYSALMRQVIDYCQARGVAMVEASNDFDSTDHQGGMFWPDVIPGNGAVPDAQGSAWTRSDYTSWGTHNMFSVAGEQTTSESTSTLGGLLGLLLSWGRQSGLSPPLTGPEAVQVLRATARPVTDTHLPWPGAPGPWSLQYGYGIPNLYQAMTAVSHRQIPPVTAITSPAWYALADPTRTPSVTVDGTISAARNPHFTWTLQAALGAQPAAGAWRTIGTGTGRGSYHGPLGTLNLDSVPRSFWTAPFHLSTTKELESTEQYALTLRLTVTDAGGQAGVDRRAVNVVHDPSWLPSFPLKLASSGESQPALVPLAGGIRNDLVFGTADGTVEAIDPATGAELPGWPVHTAPVALRQPAPGVHPGHQAVVADVAVGDLDGNGGLDVVATTLAGDVYAWDARGHPLPGWPKALDPTSAPVPVPRPALDYTRPAATGAIAAPVLVHLTGPPGRLDIVQAGLDGDLHAWAPGGTPVPGWPVPVTVPAALAAPPPGYLTVHDQTLVATPTVAWLQGRNHPPDIIEASQISQTRGSGIQPFPFAFETAYDATGHPLPGWPVRLPGLIEDYDSALQYVLEGASTAVAGDLLGAGTDQVIAGAAAGPPELISAAGHILSSYGAAGLGPPGQPLPDLPVAAASSGAIGRVDGLPVFAQPETGGVSTLGALEADNSGVAVDNFASAFPAVGGPPMPGYPDRHQGLELFGSPILAPVGPAPGNDIIDGGDANALQAEGPGGLDVPGFPKWTTGWTWYAPTAGDLLGTGHTDLVTTTREGYLFAWQTQGHLPATQGWWRWHGDNANTGNAHGDEPPTTFARPGSVSTP